MTLLAERCMGAMIGVHVGDSLGAPYETWSPKQIAEDIEKRGRLQFFDYPNPWAKDGNGKILPAGRPTDDSDQTADLAHSLIECNGLDTEHLREALRDSVVFNKSRLWDGKATGSGTTTRNALSEDAKTSKLNGVPMNNIGTNGSLMRSVPLALWLYPVLEKKNSTPIYKIVESMSSVTHTHPHSIDACHTYVHTMYGVMSQTTQLDSYGFTETLLRKRIFARLDDDLDFPYDPGAWPARGTAEFSLYVAFYALKKARSFAEGIEIAIRVGGDTDTYAAIAGGLLGAKFGYNGIPEVWCKTILGHDQMIEYAERIYELRMS